MLKLTVGKYFKRSKPAAPWEIDTRPVHGRDGSMQATRRELALFASEMMGAQAQVGQFTQTGAAHDPNFERRMFRDLIEQSELPYMVIDPRPGLHIVDINDAYAQATLTDRGCVAGSKLFDTFPDNPDDPDADGVSNLYESLQRAAQTSEPHTMALQRYDVRDDIGMFVPRYWRPVNTPVFDDEGRLVYLLHYAGELPADFHPTAPRIGKAPTLPPNWWHALTLD